jgi:hypothetical protein
MKTTVELPDELFRRAKATAAARGLSLKQYFSQALEERLRSEGLRVAEPAWKKLAGQLAPLRKETRRIQERIDEEFGHIDEEDN